MSGRPGFRRKPGNCNKPLRRDREEQQQHQRLYGPRADSFDGPSSYNDNRAPKPRPPPGLKGKALGLWYRDRQVKKNKAAEEQDRLEVTLDVEKRDEIENLLASVRVCDSGNDDDTEGSFRRSFLNKISVTFEEKIDKVKKLNPVQNPVIDAELFNKLTRKSENSQRYNEMLDFRQRLPSYKMKDEIVNTVDKNQIVVIFGETGCGKTTQVSQFILDDYILNNKGSLCKIVCTQPRRISAISVSERVAVERDEPIRENVGYQIRLEKVMPKRREGTILYVTTGVLIQWLQSDPALSEVTHLVLDEIHERDVLCDFLITLLKYIIPKRPDLRVILMSATLNAEQFSKYYGNVPCIHIPGFTYAVEEYFLEDILQMTGFRFNQFNRQNFSKKKQKEEDPLFGNYILPYVRDIESRGLYPKSVIEQLKAPESEKMNMDLIVAVIHHISVNEPEGAILVFVPGLAQIQDVHKQLTNSSFFSNSRFLIIPMHSIMPTVNQREAFKRPPKGVRKIVIATVIAETSITIDDVVYVVDSGRNKVTNFDMEINVSTLEPEWETQANAKQRRGRAGRVQAGKCYKLYTKARQEIFEPFPLPEMQRIRLEEVILQAKMLQLGRVAPFLEKVMDPPDPKAVQLSLTMLRTLNALDSEEHLTPLGFHLAKLPMDPQTGKMILMGALFSCVDPIFSVAACLSFKDPFVVPLGKEFEVNKMKEMFSKGEVSDHFIFSEAFKQWEKAESDGWGHKFAYDHFLSRHTLSLLKGMKTQFAQHLYDMNFLSSWDPKAPSNNVNSKNTRLIKAIICSGLYPNVAMIKKINKRNIRLKTIDHPKVALHPKSYVEKLRHFESPFLVYHLKLKSTSIYIHDATMVYPMPLLFFGERLDIIEEGKGHHSIRVDDMIKFSCFKKTGLLVKKLRNHLDWILESAISNPVAIDWTNKNPKTAVLKAIVELITAEGKHELPVDDDDDSDY